MWSIYAGECEIRPKVSILWRGKACMAGGVVVWQSWLRNQVSRLWHDFHHTMEILRRTMHRGSSFHPVLQNQAEFDVLH